MIVSQIIGAGGKVSRYDPFGLLFLDRIWIREYIS